MLTMKRVLKTFIVLLVLLAGICRSSGEPSVEAEANKAYGDIILNLQAGDNALDLLIKSLREHRIPHVIPKSPDKKVVPVIPNGDQKQMTLSEYLIHGSELGWFVYSWFLDEDTGAIVLKLEIKGKK